MKEESQQIKKLKVFDRTKCLIIKEAMRNPSKGVQFIARSISSVQTVSIFSLTSHVNETRCKCADRLLKEHPDLQQSRTDKKRLNFNSPDFYSNCWYDLR